MANEIIKGMGFHHMALYVSDFDKSLAFYQKLGMKVYTAWGQGDSRIALRVTAACLRYSQSPGRSLHRRGVGSISPCTWKTWRMRCKRHLRRELHRGCP